MKKTIVIFLLIFSFTFLQAKKNIVQSFLPVFSGGAHYQFKNNSFYWNADFQLNLLYLLTEEKALTLPYRSEIFLTSSVYYKLGNFPSSDYFIFYGFGVNMSFARSTSDTKKGQFFIPFIGLTFGGIYDNPSFRSGVAMLPTLGINIFSFQKSFLNISISSLLSSIDFNRHLSVAPKLSFAITF